MKIFYQILHDIGLVKFVTVLHPLNHRLEEFNIQADISFCIIFCAFSEQRINEFNENGTPRIIILSQYMQLHFYVVIQSSGQYKSNPCKC